MSTKQVLWKFNTLDSVGRVVVYEEDGKYYVALQEREEKEEYCECCGQQTGSVRYVDAGRVRVREGLPLPTARRWR